MVHISCLFQVLTHIRFTIYLPAILTGCSSSLGKTKQNRKALLTQNKISFYLKNLVSKGISFLSPTQRWEFSGKAYLVLFVNIVCILSSTLKITQSKPNP